MEVLHAIGLILLGVVFCALVVLIGLVSIGIVTALVGLIAWFVEYAFLSSWKRAVLILLLFGLLGYLLILISDK